MADARVVERAEDDADDIAEPLAGSYGKRRLTFDVRNAELIEDPDCAVSLVLEQRQVGNQLPAFPEALLPVGAGEVPAGHCSNSPQLLPACAVSASICSCSFLPSGRFGSGGGGA